MTKSQINTILTEAKRLREQNPELREGQSIFDAIAIFNLELATDLIFSEFDCFYDDKKIPQTIEFLKKVKIILKSV